MTDITLRALEQRVEETAEEVVQDQIEQHGPGCLETADWSDLAYMAADGWDWAIYNYKAQQLIDAVGPNETEDAFDSAKEFSPDSYCELVTMMAQCVIEARVLDAVMNKVENMLEKVMDAEAEAEERELDEMYEAVESYTG